MREESDAREDRELCVRELVHHRPRSGDRKERVLVAPHQLHRNVDSSMNVGELGHVAHVEALQEFGGGVAVGGDVVERSEEELVELALEQRPVHEGVAEHEPSPPDPVRAGDPTEPCTQAGQTA